MFKKRNVFKDILNTQAAEFDKMTQNSVMENANLGLNKLGIDDLIERAIQNDGLDPKILEDGDESVRQNWGKGVFDDEVVIVRSDLNSPIKILGEDQYELGGTDRIEASVPTLKELAGYGAKVVVIAHQGRLGQPDFISLEPHHRVLEELLGRKITFMRGHHYGENTQSIIENMVAGDIFLLDNIRKVADNALPSQDPVEFANAPDSYMKVLGRLAKYFVNDAFSTSHRREGSIIGFPYILNIAGRLTEKEVKENQELLKSIRPPYTLLLGGVKISDYLDSIENALEQKLVNNILAAGALGIMAVTEVDGRRINLGNNTRDFLKKEGIYRLMSRVRRLASRYPETFILPIDFKVEVNGEVTYMTPDEIHNHPNKNSINIYGLGPKTVARFNGIQEQSRTVYIKGPPTKDDDEKFLKESRELFDKTVELKRERGVTTILAGGNSHNLATNLGYQPKGDFTYATLAGSAAIEYQFGILPPGLLMLNTSYNTFNGHDLYRGLQEPGKLGFELVAPRIPALLMPR